MSTEITISELARLMEVSIHQIRYFEEKGVLLPSYTDTNGYRMYGIDQVYQLSQIMLLRKLGMPVQTIREHMEDPDPQAMEEKLQHSLTETGAEIVRLQQLERQIRKVLREQQDFQREKLSCHVKMREALPLQKWFELETAASLEASTLAEQSARVGRLFETDIHYVYSGADHVALYTAAEPGGRTDLTLPAGRYLAYSLQAENESALEQITAQFSRHAEREYGELPGPLILVEKSYLSLFSRDKLHYEVLLCIEPEGSGEGADAI
ncbi:MerR family transcriptional regulator [Paenibacillus sp. MMS20-IR301]|uniref:MerR family transcriptional regulator n=1 Tax=Paenibacillus sp. MMS20-IR301 TaxID=2895946 RepID=UPI0028F12BA4|nr:MerR family transcriptional regulator [Paenibacillus sp. MMS20-IR301]WNS44184.1 MerR family transcriptional regulator [Paenibacillus sp. MMS20-IR301]